MRILSSIEKTFCAINQFAGRVAGGICLVLVLITVADVCLRYLFRSGSVALQEFEWHLFALIFLLGAGYTLLQDGHVRVDVIYGRLSQRSRAVINLLGTLLFLIPFCILIVSSSVPFVELALQGATPEGSPDPGGLPYRFILKSAIPLGFVLLGMAAIVRLVDHVRLAFGGERDG